MFEFISARYNAREITTGILESLKEEGVLEELDGYLNTVSRTLEGALPYIYLGGVVAITTPIFLGYLYYYTHKPSLADSPLPVEIISYCPMPSLRKPLPAPIYNKETTSEASLVVDRLRSQGGAPLPKIALVGPSGSGKEALAKQMAEDASMHYISISGEDLNPSNYAEIKELINYAKKGRTLVYIDQADRVPNLQSVLNRLEVANHNLAIAYGTEKELKGGRAEFKIQLTFPELEERKRILSSNFNYYGLEEQQVDKIASQIKGFSARQIKQLVESFASMQQLNPEKMQEIVKKQTGWRCNFLMFN